MKNSTNMLASRPDGTTALCDLYGAAFLLTAGHSVTDVELDRGQRMAFIFTASDTLRTDYMRFLNNESVSVQDFVGALYRLKRLLRESEQR